MVLCELICSTLIDLSEIAEFLNAMSEEEIQAALTMICRQNNITMEELQKHYDEEFAAMVNKTILTGKVMELIRKAADVTVTED